MKAIDKLDAKTNRLVTLLPKQICTKIAPLIESMYEQFDKPRAFVEYTDPVAKDTVLSLKLLTYLQEKVVVVTQDDSRTAFLCGLCHQLDSKAANIFGVGQFNSINIDRREAPVRNILVGEIDRILYLLEKLYVKAFLLTNVVIDDVHLLIERCGFGKVKRLVMLLPTSCRKTYYHCQKLTQKHLQMLHDM